MRYLAFLLLVIAAAAAFLGYREMAGIPADAAKGTAVISFILFVLVLMLGRNRD